MAIDVSIRNFFFDFLFRASELCHFSRGFSIEWDVNGDSKKQF